MQLLSIPPQSAQRPLSMLFVAYYHILDLADSLKSILYGVTYAQVPSTLCICCMCVWVTNAAACQQCLLGFRHGFWASVRSFMYEFVFDIQCSSHVHLCYYRCPFCLPRSIDWYSRFLVSSPCCAVCKVACIKLRLMCVLQLYKGDVCVWSTLFALGSHC